MTLGLDTPPKFERATIARGLAALAKEDPPRIDRDGGDDGAGIVRQAAVITRGEALGHGHWIDSEMLTSVAEAINQSQAGVKARFTHPDLSSDGLGNFLGRFKLSRVEGDVVRGDLHFSMSAHNTPDGDLAEYVMGLAERDPDMFGTSIVFERDLDAEIEFEEAHTEVVEWTGPDGRKRQRRMFRSPDPLNKNNLSHVRLLELRAVDAVDEPAANPEGLFHRSANVAREADSLLSYALRINDEKPSLVALSVEPDRVRGFVERFFSRNQLTVSTSTEEAMDTDQHADAPDAGEAEQAVESGTVTDQQPSFNQSDIDSAAKKAADEAMLAERKRQSDIRALCRRAGCPDLAEQFCNDPDQQFTVADVQEKLFDRMCKQNTPPGDPGSEPNEDDPDAKFKAEYRRDKAHLSCSEDEYVATRRIDEGLDELVVGSAATSD